MSITVRPAKGADREFLVSLSEVAFDPYSSDPTMVMNRMMNGGEGTILIVEEASRRLGFVVVDLKSLGRRFGPWSAPRVAHVDAIAVRPDARGTGLGRLLLERAEAFAIDHGAVSISLMTAKSNVVAQTLFRSMRYQPILPIAAVYINNESAIIMTKSLSLGLP